MENKKILILYTSVGLGHKSIAENIGRQLSDAGHEVRLEDVLQLQKGRLVEMGKVVHHALSVIFPSVWSFLYQNEWFINVTLPFRLRVAAKNFRKTQLAIDSFNPDAVITTQTTASAIVAYLKRRGAFTKPFGIAFSDFHLHRYWLYDEADFYLVNIEEQKRAMEELGVPGERIYVCGMTLAPRIEADAAETKKKFDVSDGDRVILVSSGSLGSGISKQLLKNLSQHERRRIIVVCGKNQRAFKTLENYFAGSNVTILGYYAPMDELYALADIFITKPGGLSVSEALRWNLPILISHMLPGQEELNFEYLEEKGLVMPEPINIEGEVSDELDSKMFRSKLAGNPAKQVVFPKNTAAHAVGEVLKKLPAGIIRLQ